MTARAARVVRGMTLAKASVLVFVAVALLTTVFMVRMSQGEALPANPTDAAVVPHYFGPWPNWALSPTTEASATVTITGDGIGATAVATRSARRSPGPEPSRASPSPTPGVATPPRRSRIGGAGTGATADAVVTTSGSVTAITVDAPGAGYVRPVVSITGGGATTAATATVYGGIDAVQLANAGTGYTMPTVDIDAPDDPNGIQATAHAEWNLQTGVITDIVVDNPGSGYSSAPNVVIRDGTLMDPIAGGLGASATATLKVLSVVLDTFGAGYTSAPTVTISDAIGAGAGATATAAIATGGVTAINVTAPGTGYVGTGGIKKFQDDLPGLYVPNGTAPAAAQVHPDRRAGSPRVYLDPKGRSIKADEYEIALVQYRTKFNTDLPATLVRGYVQLETATNGVAKAACTTR